MMLSDKDKEIYNYIRRYMKATGFAPTYREIGAVMCLASTNTVKSHMDKLTDAGLIEWKGKQYRPVDTEIYFRSEE